MNYSKILILSWYIYMKNTLKFINIQALPGFFPRTTENKMGKLACPCLLNCDKRNEDTKEAFVAIMDTDNQKILILSDQGACAL